MSSSSSAKRPLLTDADYAPLSTSNYNTSDGSGSGSGSSSKGGKKQRRHKSGGSILSADPETTSITSSTSTSTSTSTSRKSLASTTVDDDAFNYATSSGQRSSRDSGSNSSSKGNINSYGEYGLHSSSYSSLSSSKSSRCCAKSSDKRCCCGRLTRCQCGVLATVLTLGLLGLAFIVLYFAILPKIVQNTVDGSHVEILEMSMLAPLNTSVVMASQLRLSNAGSFDATLHPANMVSSFKGVGFGIIPGSTVEIKGGEDVIFALDNRLQVINMDGFNNFSIALTNNPEVEMGLKATVSLTVHLGPIDLTFDGIDFSKTITLTGFNGLKNLTLDVFEMDVDPVTNHAISSVLVSIINPSKVSVVPLGNVTFSMFYQNSYIGSLFSFNLTMLPGVNPTSMAGPLIPANITVANQLFTQYLSGKPSLLNARPVQPVATTIPLYNAFLETLSLDVVLNGRTDYLLLTGYMDLGNLVEVFENLLKGEVVTPTALLMKNPFNAPINLVMSHLSIVYKNVQVATYHRDMHDDPVVLNPNSNTLSRDLPIAMSFLHLPDLLQSFIDELGKGYVPLGINGTMGIRIGDLENTIEYNEPPVPICHKGTMAMCNITIPA
ncbi:hypothetical protein CAOG_08917 [Capsaspora owczarzaki ATCC 30864]|uniref:Uncharacterized protein n=1 Tax=Capsaspora owczarzaki (strain ATCC 30864) TaxID=595528 RepID=A0A0D2VV50_CAPO3|nr:hypothetical protein CAOG_08917 [Capsaspora owczarzaki ATCC 30864]KJE95312.1 hypothetical protein CAOG_008917 [Capsaspora owczarzaki ATCC 30864]|eukprot:XP_011270579.1 hypothetical protein CAOG_08917 [Capsaspora owczarzaki ATCC 30864]